MAALRVYLAVALFADFYSRKAALSWTDLEHFTGLSRPMVKRGLSTLEAAALLLIDRTQRSHSYTLPTGLDDNGFVKLPKARLRSALPEMPTRGFHALDALKLYITLLRVCQRDAFTARISHAKIVEWTGTQPRRVRPAIDVLINHSLIHVEMAESSETGHPYNQYRLLGFTGGGASSNKQASPPITKNDSVDDLL
jgi:hypothetical protein